MKYLVSIVINESMEIEADDQSDAIDEFDEWFKEVYPKEISVEEVK